MILDIGHGEQELTFSTKWPEICTGGLIILLAWPLLYIPLGHDVVWQMWIGRELLHGATIYVDVLELNPPLWFWIAVPINWIAELFSIPNGSVLVLFFIAAIAISLALTAMLVRHLPIWQKAALYAMLLVVFVLMLLNDFGQREHFTLIAVWPYVLMVSQRVEDREIHWAIAIAIGLFAATGVALKHYFALAPIALEIWFFYSARTHWRLLRPETLVLCVFAITYILAILLLTPEMVSIILPQVRMAYDGYEVPFVHQFLNAVISIYILSIAAFSLYGKPQSNIAKSALVASIAFLLVYFLQQKGWRYHSLPAAGLMLIAITAEMNVLRIRDLRHKAAALLFLLAMSIPIIMAMAQGTYKNGKRPDMEAALAGLNSGDAVMMLSGNATNIWPMIEELHLTWPSRYFTHWMLPAFAARNSPELDEFAKSVRSTTVNDIACFSPKKIIVGDTRGISFRGNRNFDILSFYQVDPEFADVFSHYKPGPTFGRFKTFDLAGTIKRPATCRKLWASGKLKRQ